VITNSKRDESFIDLKKLSCWALAKSGAVELENIRILGQVGLTGGGGVA